ncbi:carboxypeptidase-like regulatory domain-containing protein [Algoriphagus marinus]|uniref:carboxypeptidase-like regulatory domain-containing protein n=1 Tax=Algoriphagus marinus TaxID=1925762 RepID=UPI0009FAFD69|nr:carboxypeptidase-like regulatory domain-containing protein [Algoriphagus marinus]
MMKKLVLHTFLFFACVAFSYAQTATISGVVKDAETGETLPYCNVFINNTTIATVTDLDGKYTISGLEPGPVEVGFSFLGYEAMTKNVTLNPGGTTTINLSMKPFAQELSDVEIKASRDKSWERDLRKFQNLFLGNDEVAALSSIENPWVIDFAEGEDKNSFLASAYAPIEIVNKYLGYKINFDLKEFYNSPTNYRIVGAARFEEMVPDSETQRAGWEQNRALVYQKSPMNMFRAMIKGDQEKEGFYLYGDKPGGSPSMNMRTDVFANELGKSVVPYKAENLITPADKPGEYLINMKGRIEIHYQKGYSQVNTYVDAPYPVSWLEVNKSMVRVRENGMVLNPQDLVFSGDMDRKRISTLLPLDYDAEKAIQLQNLERTAANFQEKIYVHTDKPYYYAGDQLYFKAYFNYGNPYLRDELSKVLQVEIINGDRDFILEKKFKIMNGIVVGDFRLPDTLSQEKYYLRAYTNWNRNYGPNHYFTTGLRVLTPYQRVVEGEKASFPSMDRVKILSDKPQYGPKEKVTLTIQTRNERNLPVQATLSVSVLDQNQIIPIRESKSIQKELALEKIPETMGLDRFSYEVEKSLNQKGVIYDEKGKPTSGQVVIFVNDFEGMLEMETNRDGEFAMQEMEFYGKMDLAIQATDRKGKPVSDVELVEPLKAPVALPADAYFPELKTVADPIRSLEKESEYQELDSVTVEEKGTPKTPKAIYGTPSYVVTGDKLLATGNTTDLVNSLAGNVPGMRVTVEGSSGRQQIRIRSGSTSVSGSMEPIVMLNGSMMVSTGSTTAADNLKSINPFDVDRVEIVSRTVSMLGDDGRNGVIAVYLKNFDPNAPQIEGAKSTGFREFEIEGFQPTSSFFQIDYSQEKDQGLKDFRQTLYWNPYLVTDDSGNVTISFYTNETGEPMTIHVRGLGLDGLPVSGGITINTK